MTREEFEKKWEEFSLLAASPLLCYQHYADAYDAYRQEPVDTSYELESPEDMFQKLLGGLEACRLRLGMEFEIPCPRRGTNVHAILEGWKAVARVSNVTDDNVGASLISGTDMLVRINAPEWYRDPDFCRWLRSRNTATWCAIGEDPNEESDAFFTYDDGDGSDAPLPNHPHPTMRGLPEHIWSQVCALIEASHGKGIDCLVWVSNLPE